MQTDRVRLETTIADTARLHDDVLANKQEVGETLAVIIDIHHNPYNFAKIIMPRCACASEVYGSVFVCLSVCLCRLLQLLKDQ